VYVAAVFTACLRYCRCAVYSSCMVLVVAGFPVYIGEPETYMHLRRSDLMTASTDTKNAITVLNELYYESAVYTSENDGNEQMDGFCLVSVTVDGITAYGQGPSKKEAKLSAACSAVHELRRRGILQRRISEKELAKTKTSASEKPVPYRHTVCSVTPDNAIAKLNHVYVGLNYNVTSYNSMIGDTSYTVSVNVNGHDFIGTGRSKKVARLAAAESALRALNMWTADDENAKKQAKLSALAAQKMTEPLFNVSAIGRPVSRGSQLRGRPRGFRSVDNIRGKPVPRAGRMVRGQTIRGRGSFLDGQTHGFLSTGYAERGSARGQRFRARGSGMLRRGTRGGVLGAQGSASNFVGYTEIPRDKNPVMLLNEVYYSTAVYEYSEAGEPWAGEQCCLTVDGVTVYGTGPTKKDAKLGAATAAVQQLEAAGILQKRLADKADFMSQKHAQDAIKKQQFWAQPQQVPARKKQLFAQVRSARMQRGRPVPGRGRVAQRQGSRAVGRRGFPNVQSFYPQTANTDFTTVEDVSFTSFEDTIPNTGMGGVTSFEDTIPIRGMGGARLFRAPRTANSARRGGRMRSY